MPKRIVYRYDNECYKDGEITRPRGDFFSTLTDSEKQVELAIRSTLPDGANIRSTSVCTWANENLAKRLWPRSRKKYLYELEIDDFNIRHIGDLNWYSAAKDAVNSGELPKDAVDKYCSGENAGPPYTEPRIEVLVSEAKVRKRLPEAARQ